VSTISSRDISFVVQGAIDRAATPACIQSIRQWYPGAEIVLSTWESADVNDLDYDVLVTSPDPGAYNVMLPGTVTVMGNGNRQIVSTRNGLLKASRKYVVKLRNDIVFSGDKWLDMWDRFPERFPEWRMFRERVIIGSWYARNPRKSIWSGTANGASDSHQRLFGSCGSVSCHFLSHRLRVPGPIYATPATVDLARILLPDAGHLQEEEARFRNKHGLSKHAPALPLYTIEDADAAIRLLRAADYGPTIELYVPAQRWWSKPCPVLTVKASEARASSR